MFGIPGNTDPDRRIASRTAFQPKLSAFRSSLPVFAFVHSTHLTFLAHEICYDYDKGLDLDVFSTHSGLTDLK
jgi:hypothetical protein